MAVNWNHNTHYHALVLDAVPEGCALAVDIGCGDGRLTAELAARAERVIGLESDERMVQVARAVTRRSGRVTIVHADPLTWRAPAGGVDLVCCVAGLHAWNQRAVLTRMRDMLRPGGRLVVIGLAVDRGPRDRVQGALCAPLVRLVDARHHFTDPGPPLVDPPESWGQMRRLARDVLPGSRFRRLLLSRYSLTWERPRADPGPRPARPVRSGQDPPRGRPDATRAPADGAEAAAGGTR